MEIARAVNSNQSPLLRALPGAPLSCGQPCKWTN